jgi:hypothetical protein
MCFDFLYEFFLKHFSFWEELSEMWSKTYIGLHIKYLLFLSDFNETWIFSKDFLKNTPISSFMKIRPVGADLFLADRRTNG